MSFNHLFHFDSSILKNRALVIGPHVLAREALMLELSLNPHGLGPLFLKLTWPPVLFQLKSPQWNPPNPTLHPPPQSFHHPPSRQTFPISLVRSIENALTQTSIGVMPTIFVCQYCGKYFNTWAEQNRHARKCGGSTTRRCCHVDLHDSDMQTPK